MFFTPPSRRISSSSGTVEIAVIGGCWLPDNHLSFVLMDQVMKELIVYTRTIPCPDCARAKRVLEEYGIPYTEIMIDLDAEARARVESWTGGFQAVPTLVLTRPGELFPLTEPRPLEAGRSP